MQPIDIKGKARELGIEFPVTSEQWNLLTGGDHGPAPPEPSPELAALAAEMAEAAVAYNAAHDAVGAIIIERNRADAARQHARGVQYVAMVALPRPEDSALSDDPLDLANVARGRAADRMTEARARYYDAAKREEMRRLGAPMVA
jgi:hypothetical protein